MPTGVAPHDFSFPVVPFTQYGNTTAFTDQGSFGQNYLLGQTIAATVSGRLRKLGLIAGTAGPDGEDRSLYGRRRPAKNLIAQIPSRTVAAGVNEFALASPVVLPAGTY